VLEADTKDTAIALAITHSRPIHVLLVGARMDAQQLVQKLRRYRPNLHVVYVTADWTYVRDDVLLPDAALSKVRELLGTRGFHRAAAAAG
jgi:hypothetical protein